MATIQNQAIIQKLIDELELYPALEKMPTELAEKILPVFQVNSEQLEVQMKPNYLLWQDTALNDADKTLTVPDKHTYVIKQGNVNFISTATVGERRLRIEIKDNNGVMLWAGMSAAGQIASKEYEYMISSNYYKAVADINASHSHFSIPPEFVLKEGYTFRVWDAEGIALAADDMTISLMVDDQTD